MTTHHLLETDEITKSFPGVLALDSVDFDIDRGEVHALVGENGAGKSTLMHILSGALLPDSGKIRMEGKPVRFRSPREAEAAGVSIIHQELSLVPHMSVAENIFLGHTPRTAIGSIAWKKLYSSAKTLLETLELDIDVRAPLASFPIGIQQMIEIAKALSQEASLIIMDEPTSSLSENEADHLFGLIRQLKERGKGIVYITHRMEEIFRIADRITVLRDGRRVGTDTAKNLPGRNMISWMVGREKDSFYSRSQNRPGRKVLDVKNLSVAGSGPHAQGVDNVSLSLRAGEIVGLAGLRGSGSSEFMGALFGRYGRRSSVESMESNGTAARIIRQRDAIRHGIALLTNDRKTSGLVMPMSVAKNITLASQEKARRFGLLFKAAEKTLAEPLRKRLDIRVPTLDSEVWSLTGGNPKWLLTGPGVFLLDEPTRGIDVGAKAEIYRLMNEWTADGKAILLISSELPELIAMSDRIVVMRQGRVSATLSGEEATPENVMAAAV